MKTAMGQWLAIAAISLLCSGCFVLDELDAGQQIMDAHAPKEKRRAKAKTAKPAAAGKEESAPGVAERGAAAVETVKGWWVAATEGEPPGPDPNDAIGRCRIGGGTQFMRASDCQLRGGSFARMPPRDADETPDEGRRDGS